MTTASTVLPSNVHPNTTTAAKHGDEARAQRAVRGALLLVGALLVLGAVAVVVPWPMPRPLWVKVEVVFAGCWLVWAVTLSRWFYRGLTLEGAPSYADDDSSHHEHTWLEEFVQGIDPDIAGGDDLFHLVAGLVLLVTLALVGWLLVEVVVPLLFAVSYALMWRLLTVVLRASQACKGSLAQSATRGLMWATLLTLPLAAIAASVHILG